MSRSTKRPYRKSRAFDASCRCHGSCPWCRGNRGHKNAKRVLAAEQAVVAAAETWGKLEVGEDNVPEDEVAHLAAEIGMAMALGELQRARAGTPNPNSAPADQQRGGRA